MKKLVMLVIALVMSAATLQAANVTDTGPGQPGDVLYYTGPAGNDQGTWSSLPSLVQTIINNNTITPATVGTSLNGGSVSTVGNVDVTGTGITQTVTGSGASGVSSYDFSGLQTNQSIQNTTDISNLSTTVNSNSTDISSLQTTVADHSTHLTTLDNGLAQEVIDRTNGDAANATALNNETTRATGVENTLNQNITNETARATSAENAETTRATGAENTLQNNLNTETNQRVAGDQALQSQINSINAQAADNTARIDRLEQTKYLLEPVVRLYDSKRFQVQAFDSYDVRHGLNAALGLRVMLKVGKSYEEKLLAKTNPEVARLLANNVQHDSAKLDAIYKQLAEDKALIAKQSELLAKLSAASAPAAGVLDVKVSSRPFGEPSKADEDLLQAMEDRAEASVR